MYTAAGKTTEAQALLGTTDLKKNLKPGRNGIR